ncbi:MAG: phosphoribosylanthranilate isomerase [Rhodospirillaceae bacterium]|nr:phosphoribosylanthranilate isomerase [Rhodospirillaceae bacterium]MBT3927022.1 phosphoribosylanthranilate isomerase [Rhodospirillaceae bacterium]MBT4427752.1 phosphoribosylanthranilate isomerase [Rhodospirillaceae bacterium]MBT5040507.1 phosphoribosylanthranilate isomerase [Rhodospirillaceae bacterium]MBT5779032.1 phosphoribosylanthranilate isomerase [Rhodospirillaceae bacterium]
MARTRVKICCISSLEEARLAVSHGADALGLVSNMPSGPGVIDEALIGDIARAAPPAIGTFLLTSALSADEIIAQQNRCHVNTIQIVDALPHSEYAHLRDALPGVALVQVVHVRGEESVAEARAVAGEVSAVLLDSGNPTLEVKELGGTGRVHDWSLSRAIVEALDIPVFLAGGLRPENVGEAIAQVQPFGVDLCSSVRTDDRLDGEKLSSFFAAVEASNA